MAGEMPEMGGCGDALVGERILLVDDDEALAALMSSYLRTNGFTVDVLHHGDAVEAAVLSQDPDLLVLDLMLPGKDGLSICRDIRDRFAGPIIMLTALSDDIDEVTGLEVGADDYLAKPIRPRVLLAHIRAQLRRSSRGKTPDTPDRVIACGGSLRIDMGRRAVDFAGRDVALTSAEFDLLWILAQHCGSVVRREDLHMSLYRLEYDGVDRSIDLRVSRIRRKLDTASGSTECIKTVRNVGYQLVN